MFCAGFRCRSFWRRGRRYLWEGGHRLKIQLLPRRRSWWVWSITHNFSPNFGSESFTDLDQRTKLDWPYLDLDSRDDGRSNKKKSRWSSQEVTSQACLEGFSQAEYKSAVIKTFPLPVLPKDFRPVCNVKPSRFEPVLADKKRPLADPVAKPPQEVRRDTEPRERSRSSPKLLEKPTDFTRCGYCIQIFHCSCKNEGFF